MVRRGGFYLKIPIFSKSRAGKKPSNMPLFPNEDAERSVYENRAYQARKISRNCRCFVSLWAFIASFFNARLQKPLKAQRICHWVRLGSFMFSPPFAAAKAGDFF
jgi:hypothetical protein